MHILGPPENGPYSHLFVMIVRASWSLKIVDTTKISKDLRDSEVFPALWAELQSIGSVYVFTPMQAPQGPSDWGALGYEEGRLSV
jgi:hypothetical protein